MATEQPASRRLLTPPVIIALAVCAYFAVLLHYTCYFVAGPDSSGYGNEAKLLAKGRVRVFVEPLRTFNLDPVQMTTVFTPFGFTNGGHSTLVPTYPAGAPIHMAVAAMIGGWETAPFVVSPLAAIGCLVLLYAICGELAMPLLDRFMAMVILAAMPSFIAHAVQPVSDIVGAFWTLAAIWFGLRSRSRLPFAFAAGAAVGIAVWVRPTNLLIALPVAFALRWRIRALMGAAIAALPFGIALMWFNNLLYGSPLRTGYGGVGDVVALPVMLKCGPAHLWWILKIMTPLIMPVALLVAFDRRLDRLVRATLLSWFGVFWLFYSMYGICDEFDIRFLIPALPPLIIGSLLVIRRWSAAAHPAVAIVLLVVIVANEIYYDGRRWHVLRTEWEESVYSETAAWAAERLPGNAFVVSGLMTGAFYYYDHRLTARWDQIEPARYEALANSAASTLPWYAVVFEGEADSAELARRMPGRWTKIDSYRNANLWRRER